MWANEKAIGRNWATADRAALTVFDDCARANLYWDDGGEAYILEDTKELALEHLARLGFAPAEAASLQAQPEFPFVKKPSVIYTVGTVIEGDRKDFTDVREAVAAFRDAKAGDRPYLIRSERLPDGREMASIPGDTTYEEKGGHREYGKWIGGNDEALNSAWRETFISHDEMFSLMVQLGMDASLDAAKMAVSRLTPEDCFSIARADGQARLEVVRRVTAGQESAPTSKPKVYLWTPTEALAQAEAALPDVAFADRCRLDKDLIRRIVAINGRAKKGPVPDSEVVPVLKEAFAALPAAWKDHGGVSEELSSSIANTIRRAEEAIREDSTQFFEPN